MGIVRVLSYTCHTGINVLTSAAAGAILGVALSPTTLHTTAYSMYVAVQQYSSTVQVHAWVIPTTHTSKMALLDAIESVDSHHYYSTAYFFLLTAVLIRYLSDAEGHGVPSTAVGASKRQGGVRFLLSAE